MWKDYKGKWHVGYIGLQVWPSLLVVIVCPVYDDDQNITGSMDMFSQRLIFTLILMVAGSGCSSPHKEIHLSDKAIDWASGDEISVERFMENPIIQPQMLPGDDGVNINGPSLIRVPDWVTDPLGQYYLYFAHHGGKYIRLAYADDLRGPWRIHQPGTLQLAQAKGCGGHIASPDVHVDDAKQEIRMYYHGVVYGDHGRPIAQRTFLAHSQDGLNFESDDVDLGPSYFRVFRYGEYFYALDNGGTLYRSVDGESTFEKDDKLLQWEGFKGRARHTAVYRVDDHLWVFYSRIGDTPERLMVSRVELDDDWRNWQVGQLTELLQPAFDYEGVDLQVETSVSGLAREKVHQLRDPGIFVEDGRVYLLYSVAGESGIGMAELK